MASVDTSPYASKPWLSDYGSIPHSIDADRYPNLISMVDEACEQFPEKIAYSNFGSTLSYQQTLELSKNFAAWLQHKIGIKKGDRVALMAPNMLAFPVAMFGILRAGAIQVNVNPLYTPRELQHQLNDSQVDTVVIFAAATKTLADIIENTSVKHIVVLQLSDFVSGINSSEIDSRLSNYVGFDAAIEEGKHLTVNDIEITGEDLLFLQYTGGTTGPSKGAMLSHRNLVANILQYEAMAQEITEWGNEVVMTAIPMYHIFALMVNTLTYFRYGATNILITNPRDMASFVAEWSKWQVTVFTGVNTLYNGLLRTEGFDDLDFSRLKICIGGGAAVQEAVSNKWQQATGQHITQAYGLSETSPVLHANPLSKNDFNGTIGIPIPSTEIKLLDDNDNEVPIGEAGELCARGPQVMPGYWQCPEATEKAMTADGYFRTGDVATMTAEGYFQIVDRKKDMILVSGFNVYPNEIEGVVAEIPQVTECACVGIPNDDTGEAVMLFVVKNDNDLNANTVIEYCRKELAAYKVPKQVQFIEELPKSTVGKILRRELRKIN